MNHNSVDVEMEASAFGSRQKEGSGQRPWHQISGRFCLLPMQHVQSAEMFLDISHFFSASTTFFVLHSIHGRASSRLQYIFLNFTRVHIQHSLPVLVQVPVA
jgi:hypothetical protein